MLECHPESSAYVALPGRESGQRPRVEMRRSAIAACATAYFAFASRVAQAAIPQSERDALLVFHASTNGDGWTDHSGWNGASGTECSWRGIGCDAAGAHVAAIDLRSNHLPGSLPALNDLPKLFFFHVEDNQPGGALPALGTNRLTGVMPSLAELGNLVRFHVDYNQSRGAYTSVLPN